MRFVKTATSKWQPHRRSIESACELTSITRRGAAGVAQIGKEALHFVRFRSRVCGVDFRARRAINDGAEKPGCEARGMKYRVHKKAGGRFPARARDADEFQRGCRMAEDICRGE